MNLRVKAIQKGINKNIAASSEMLKKKTKQKQKQKVPRNSNIWHRARKSKDMKMRLFQFARSFQVQ